MITLPRFVKSNKYSFLSFANLFPLYSWKIPQSNLIHYALRYDDTHKFVTEQVIKRHRIDFFDQKNMHCLESFSNSYWTGVLSFPFPCES